MKLAASLLGILLLSTMAYGHHSQAHFSDQFSQLQGELVSVDWRNPHIRFTLRTDDADGEESLVRIETNSIYYLERAGVTKDRINVGDQVTIGGYASNIPGGEFLAAEMLLADGETAQFIRTAVTEQFKDQLADGSAENKGVFRVWSIPQTNVRIQHLLLTEQAAAAKLEFDPLDNFSTRCEPSGMPRLMWYPHPFAFEDQGDEVLIRMEMYDEVRTVHMDQAEAPNNLAHSRLGYSVGRWEDNALVIETSHINWNYYDTSGTPQTEQVEVVERYSLSQDQTRLDYHITTSDPETFAEPATISGHWLALGEEIKPYDCDVY